MGTTDAPVTARRTEETSYDESDWARRVADALGIESVTVPVHAEDMSTLLAELVRSAGEPLGDPAWVPTALLARRAAVDVKLALVGEGGDELFGGYPTYTGAWLSGTFAKLPRPLRATLARLVRALPDSEKKVALSWRRVFVVAMAPSGVRAAGDYIPTDRRDGA